MPLANYLLSLRFDQSGCINKDYYDLGGCNYLSKSAILPQKDEYEYLDINGNVIGGTAVNKVILTVVQPEFGIISINGKTGNTFTFKKGSRITVKVTPTDSNHIVEGIRINQAPSDGKLRLNVKQPQHGSIIINGKKDTSFTFGVGDKVTIVVTPDIGYQVDNIVLTEGGDDTLVTTVRRVFVGNRSIYFEPYNDFACLSNYTPNEVIKDHFSKLNDFTIYFKYKINAKDIDKNKKIPIISYNNIYENGNNNQSVNITIIQSPHQTSSVTAEEYKETVDTSAQIINRFLYIEEGSYFTININKNESYSSKIIDYTFDGNWHTFTITKKDKKVRFFIDGCLSTTNTIKSTKIDFGNIVYIGYSQSTPSNISTYTGWLDDINILDQCLYENTFIPPTLYLGREDSISNYYLNDISNTSNIEQDIIDQVEYNMQSTVHHYNESQRGWLPQRLRIKWYEEDSYFSKTEYTRVNKTREYTVLSLYNMTNPLIGDKEDRFFEGNAYQLFHNGRIQGFMLFVDKKFIPLSKIYIIRSDWWYTIKLLDRDPVLNGKVQSVEFITIPFPIIYTENIGEDETNIPIYRFNKDGMFDNSVNALYFYYIDKYKCDFIGTRGIFEQNIPSLEDKKETGEDIYKDTDFMHFSWRYGEFHEKYILGDSLLMQFRSWDKGYVKPGDIVLIYKNTILIDPERYRIVGNDLVQFYNYKELNYKDQLFTMQVVTDNSDWLISDYTDLRVIKLTATIDNQSVFKIPIDELPSGKTYNHVMIFRGSVCIENENRYKLDTTKNTLTFTNTEDFVPINSDVYIYFCNINMTNQYGPLHIKPIYVYTRTSSINKLNTLELPDLNGLQYTVNNCCIFVQDTFISPRRYKIENNILTLLQPNDLFNIDESVVIVTFKMVDQSEDPTDKHYEIIHNEQEKGKRFVLYDLGINRYTKLTLDNFIVFDGKGRYIPDLYGKVYNRNIIRNLYTDEPLSRVPRYLTCLWIKDGLENKANTILPTNDGFLNGYISLLQEFYEMDNHFKEFMSDFNVKYNQNKHYGENLSKALNFMVCYNQSVFNTVYNKRATSYRHEIDYNKFNAFLEQDGEGYYTADIEIDEFKNKLVSTLKRTYPIFFVNGQLPVWYKDITYSGNTMHIKLENMIGHNDNDNKRLTITVLQPEHGTIKVNGKVGINFKFRPQTEVKIEVEPDKGYTLNSLYVDEDANTYSNNITTKYSSENISDYSSSVAIVKVTQPDHGMILVNGTTGKSFIFKPGNEITFTCIPDAGYMVNNLLISETNIDPGTINIDSFEVIKVRGINNYLQLLNNKITKLTNTNILNEFISKIIVGTLFNNFELNSKVSVINPEYNRDFLYSKVTIKDDYIIPHNDWNVEFTGTIGIKAFIEDNKTSGTNWFNGTVNIYKPPTVPDYTPPEGMNGPEYYEIYCKLEPGYEFTPYDLTCTIKVPINIIEE